MDGSYVESATAGMTTDKTTGKNSYVVQLKLKSSGDKNGKELFGNITKEYLNQQVSIWMDDIMLSAPKVDAEITDGNAVISGSFTAKEAQDLASKLMQVLFRSSLKHQTTEQSAQPSVRTHLLQWHMQVLSHLSLLQSL